MNECKKVVNLKSSKRVYDKMLNMHKKLKWFVLIYDGNNLSTLNILSRN